VVPGGLTPCYALERSFTPVPPWRVGKSRTSVLDRAYAGGVRTCGRTTSWVGVLSTMMGARPTYGAGAVGVGHGGSVPRWSLRLLGPFVLECDGVPVTGFRSDKVRALLAYLAVEPGRPWSRSTLADLLWPDRPEGVARSNLRSALSNLRRVLDDARADLVVSPTEPQRRDLAT
jgi:hypothetical protein